MTTFIEKVRPFLFSEDEVLRHAWLFQLHDYPAVPVELVNELLVFCQQYESTRKKVLINLENSPKDEVINKGQTLNHAFEKHTYFPRTFVQIVKIGEEAGNLSEVAE